MLANFIFDVILMGIEDCGGYDFSIFVPSQRIPLVAFIFGLDGLLNCLFLSTGLILTCSIQRYFPGTLFKQLFLVFAWDRFFGFLFLFLFIMGSCVFIFCILVLNGVIFGGVGGMLWLVGGEDIFVLGIGVGGRFLAKTDHLFLEILDPMDTEYFRLILHELLSKGLAVI